MYDFYDCHAHEYYGQKEGFLIALDGIRGCDGGYGNNEIIDVARRGNLIPVQYACEGATLTETDIIKYHPRREKYSAEWVRMHINEYNPKLVIIDTLNQPFWQPIDYWNIVKAFPDKKFLLSHAGGFDILDFLKIVFFEKNVWLDFSFTQHVFGWCGGNMPMPHVVNHIDYALRDKRVFSKLLFGSDSMRGEQEIASEAIVKYQKYASYNEIMNNNFCRLKEECNL